MRTQSAQHVGCRGRLAGLLGGHRPQGHQRDDNKPLTWKEQFELITTCLESDAHNIKVVAKYLVRMIKADYPNIDTTKLMDEQFISRSLYNGGPARALKDYRDSLKAPQGTVNREYTSYGRAMMKPTAEVRALLGI